MEKPYERISIKVSKNLKEDIALSAKQMSISTSQYLLLLHKARTDDSLEIQKQLYNSK